MIVSNESYIRSKWMNGLGETLQLIIQPEGSDFKLQ
jgi:environmental stress-induced protein Ves